jgi:uncharacterized protein YndB with AHSA1/START domain
MQVREIPVIPGTVTSSIEVDAPVAAVFAGFSSPDIRSVWSKLPGRDRTYELDFRVGGWELRTSTFPNIERDESLDVRTRFVEIIDERRVVATVELRLDDVLRITSLVVWELTEIDGRTRVDYTEQYQVLVPTGDGSADQGERKGATPMMLRGFKLAVEQAA